MKGLRRNYNSLVVKFAFNSRLFLLVIYKKIELLERCVMASIVYDKSKKFAFRIIKLYKYLIQEYNEPVMTKQLLRCGTSIGANITEAEYAISKKEFVMKMYIAFKECGETIYWLDLLFAGKYITEKQYQSMKCDCEELMRLLSSITKTTREQLDKSK